MAGGSNSVQRTPIPGVDLDVRELARFLAWLEGAGQSAASGAPMPDPPVFQDQTVTRWSQIILGLAAGADQVKATSRAAGLNLRA